jgi:hypothetical protein
VFDNKVPRETVGPKGHDVTGKRRKLHNNELHNLYLSSDIIRHIKSRRMMWAGHVACMGEKWKLRKFLVGKPEKKETKA